MRITPEEIVEIEEDEVFVFGSNESGIHGSGAARFAHKFLGAVFFQGFGPAGKTFALPTKDWEIESLPLETIQGYVDRFLAYTQTEAGKPLTFLVIKVGCGLAGFTPEQIAPMFAKAVDMKNVFLPEEFWKILLKDELTEDESVSVTGGEEDVL